jgi:hypothetical protein
MLQTLVSLTDKATREYIATLWRNQSLLIQERKQMDILTSFNDTFEENCRSHIRRIVVRMILS